MGFTGKEYPGNMKKLAAIAKKYVAVSRKTIEQLFSSEYLVIRVKSTC
jgi:hypothetical protein